MKGRLVKRQLCAMIAALGLLMAWNCPLHAKKSGEIVAGESPEQLLVRDVSLAFQSHDFKRVIRLYREFAASKPDRYLPLIVKVLYSQALADTGETDDAIEALQSVLEQLPPAVDPLQLQYDLANLLFQQKRYDEAKSAYSRLVIQASGSSQILSQAKSRLSLLKEREGGKRKDFDSLEMIDLETALDAGEIPEGAEAYLRRIAERNGGSPQSLEAGRLQNRIKELKSQKAKTMLDEARRLFDVEKKYGEVLGLLDRIERLYPDVAEKPSLDALRSAVLSKMGKSDGQR